MYLRNIWIAYNIRYIASNIIYFQDENRILFDLKSKERRKSAQDEDIPTMCSPKVL